MRTWICLLALVSAFALAGCSEPADVENGPQAAGETDSPEANPADGNQNDAKRAADVTLETVSFAEFEKKLESYRGKVVVLDCWSTSCTPCMEEFHNLVELHKKYGPETVACVSFSFDNEGFGDLEEIKERVVGFLKTQNATFDNYISAENSEELYDKLGIDGSIPVVLVYAQDGELVERFDEPVEGGIYEPVREKVAELVADAEPRKL